MVVYKLRITQVFIGKESINIDITGIFRRVSLCYVQLKGKYSVRNRHTVLIKE